MSVESKLKEGLPSIFLWRQNGTGQSFT